MSLFNRLPEEIQGRIRQAATDMAAEARIRHRIVGPEPQLSEGRRLVETAWRMLRDAEATTWRDRCYWRMGVADLGAIRADPDADPALELPTGPDAPWWLFGLPVELADEAHFPLTLVQTSQGVTLPEGIAQLPGDQRVEAVRFAEQMAAAIYGDSTAEGVERCLRMVAQVLDAGADSFQVIARTDLRTMIDGEIRELDRRTFQIPVALHQASRQGRHDCSQGHIVTVDSLVCQVCGTDVSEPVGYDAVVLDRVLDPVDCIRGHLWEPSSWGSEVCHRCGADTSQSEREGDDRPEPVDPVEWLERGLEDVLADQDAASIKARLEAIEGTLAEVNPSDRPEVNWSDSYSNPYGLAAHWPVDGPRADDHLNHVHFAPTSDLQVSAGFADASGPNDWGSIGNLATVRFGQLQQGQVHCLACGADVERLTIERRDLEDVPQRLLYDPIRYVLADFPTMTVYPCGHTDGFTWSDPAASGATITDAAVDGHILSLEGSDDATNLDP
jgi:hypothetical protein